MLIMYCHLVLKKEGFHYNEGSYFYRNIFYKCPHCGVDCCIEMHNRDMFVRQLVENEKKRDI